MRRILESSVLVHGPFEEELRYSVVVHCSGPSTFHGRNRVNFATSESRWKRPDDWSDVARARRTAREDTCALPRPAEAPGLRSGSLRQRDGEQSQAGAAHHAEQRQ